MNIEISARHFEITDSLREHVDEKLSVMGKFYDGIDNVHVILDLSSGISRSHVQLRGDRLRLDSRSKGHDMYFSFDDCVSSLERQLKKFKETHHNHPHRIKDGNILISGAWYVAAEPSELTAPVLLEDAAELQRFSTNAAMTEFEVSGSDENLIFFNTETDCFSAAYRTSTGATQVVELARKE
ncbi:MAG: ribosome-associated translation inhibitor RaiA [Candidatus Sabulitectum sp.]|nr:ribosome-associated translation inhibitor RaiA [Candidatus Sabulitectum sp.]